MYECTILPLANFPFQVHPVFIVCVVMATVVVVVVGVPLASPLASVAVVAQGVASPPVEPVTPVSLPTAGSLWATMKMTSEELLMNSVYFSKSKKIDFLILGAVVYNYVVLNS